MLEKDRGGEGGELMCILIDKSCQHLLNGVLKLQNVMQEKSKEEKCLFLKKKQTKQKKTIAVIYLIRTTESLANLLCTLGMHGSVSNYYMTYPTVMHCLLSPACSSPP